MDPRNNKVLYAAIYQRRRAAVGHERRRARQRHLEVRRRRRDLDQARDRAFPSGAQGPHRPRRLPRKPNVLYARVEHATESGIYRIGRRRAPLAQDERRQSAARCTSAMIRIDPQTDSRIYVPRRPAPRLRRRRPDVPGRRRRAHPRRSSTRIWINPANPEHLLIGNDGGVEHVATTAPPPGCGFPTCCRRRRITSAFDMQDAVSRVRRPAGQQHLVRAERACAPNSGIAQRRLVRRQRRRRLPAAHGSDRRADHLRRVAGRPDEPRRSRHQRAADGASGTAEAKAGEPSQFRYNWDTRDAALAARSGHDLHRRATGC